MFIVSSIIMLAVIIIVAYGESSKGVYDKKFYGDANLLTLFFLPIVIKGISMFTDKLMNPALSGFIAFLGGLLILIYITRGVLNNYTEGVREQYGKEDKRKGFMIGILRGFMILFFITLLYGGLFLDRVTPKPVAEFFKQNPVNYVSQWSVDYYRSKVFSLAKVGSDFELKDIFGTEKYNRFKELYDRKYSWTK